jgi:hypothetical protein
MSLVIDSLVTLPFNHHQKHDNRDSDGGLAKPVTRVSADCNVAEESRRSKIANAADVVLIVIMVVKGL